MMLFAVHHVFDMVHSVIDAGQSSGITLVYVTLCVVLNIHKQHAVRYGRHCLWCCHLAISVKHVRHL